MRKRGNGVPPIEIVAGNGLIDRRALLGRGIVVCRRSRRQRRFDHRARPRSRWRSIRGASDPGEVIPAYGTAVEI